MKNIACKDKHPVHVERTQKFPEARIIFWRLLAHRGRQTQIVIDRLFGNRWADAEEFGPPDLALSVVAAQADAIASFAGVQASGGVDYGLIAYFAQQFDGRSALGGPAGRHSNPQRNGMGTNRAAGRVLSHRRSARAASSRT